MNKRKSARSFPLAATIILIVVAAFGVTFAIKVLMVKYAVVQGGNELKKLERELNDLTVKNEALLSRKDQLTSPPRLQAALDKGLINLIKIDEKSVIRVGRPVRQDVAAVISMTSAAVEDVR